MNTYEPQTVTPPYDTLEELIEEKGLNLDEVSAMTDINVMDLALVMLGSIPICPDIAQKLESGGFSVAEFWNKRTKRYEEWREKQSVRS